MRQIKINQSVTARTMTVDSYLRDISSKPMVSPDEETELAIRIQQGDEDAYRRLVEANLRFVVSVAKQYQSSGLDLCDLINEGNIGLIKAARRFDPTRGFRFISYAVWWIRQSIMQAISDQGRIVRLPLNQIAVFSKINKARTKFSQENEREPSDEELAEFTDLTPESIGEVLSHSARHISFDTPFDEESDGTLLDVIPDTSIPDTDESMKSESLRKDISDVMDILNARERQIVRLSFGLGCPEMTLEEIGGRMDLTRERVRQIRLKAIRKMSRPEVRSRLAQYL